MAKTIVNIPVVQNVEMAFQGILTLSKDIRKIEVEKISISGLHQVFETAMETGKNIMLDILAQIANRVRNIRLETRTDGDVVVVCYV